MKKLLATKVILMLALFAGFALPAQAQDKSELQAEINALMGEIVEAKSSSVSGGPFTADLTLGSSGPEVEALQRMLEAEKHLILPEGVAYGYFGSMTQSAVAKWQAAHGINPTGYWGVISRSKIGVPQGGITVGGTIGTATTTTAAISTPGSEGTLSVSLIPLEGGITLSLENSKVKVFDLEITASSSDIRVERIAVDLGTDRDIYQDILAKVYVLEGEEVVASRDLDKLTVVNDGRGNLSVTISGLNLLVRKDESKAISIVVEARHSINSVRESSTWTLTLPASAVRGVDGMDANVYAPSTEFSRSFRVEPVVPEEPVSAVPETPAT